MVFAGTRTSVRTTNAQESIQLLLIQSQALFVIHYMTHKSKNNGKCHHDAVLNELSYVCIAHKAWHIFKLHI